MHNIMAKAESNYTMAPEVRERILQQMRNLFDEYDYNYEDHALNKILDKYCEEKGQVINILSKHPAWDAERLMVKFNTDFKRAVNLNELGTFFNWCEDCVAKRSKEKIPTTPYTENETVEIIRRNQRFLDIFSINGVETVNGKTKEDYQKIINHFNDYYRTNFYGNQEWFGVKVTREDYKICQNLDILFNILKEYFRTNIDEKNVHLCPEDIAETINSLFPDTAVAGQKISRILGKIGKSLGLDTVVDVRDASFYDNNGRWVERTKNFGWSYRQAMMGDAINPFIITRHTLISVNPIDYLTMSFGHEWGSCHGIDRGQRIGNHYQGEYCAGTLSYMLDPSSFIFYTVDADYDGDEFELQDKMQRCVMAIGGDKLYEGRVYPDGRDGGDRGLATQFRNVVQKVIADCLEVDNLWKIEKGSTPCDRNMSSGNGKAYEDWTCCPDSVMSFLKINDEINEEDSIWINYPAICVNCGYEIDESSSLNCSDCDGSRRCPRCDCRISAGDGLTMEDGTVYCDSYCAENDDYVYCEDADGWYYYEYVHKDDYTGEYFYYEDEMVDIDGNIYRNADNAESAGYREVDGEWFDKDDVYEDDYTGDDFVWDEETSVATEDGNHYVSAENAEADGYIFNTTDGIWEIKPEEDEESEVTA